jgi:probable rRNA maturation factor
MILLETNIDINIDIKKLEDIVNYLGVIKDIELLIVSDKTIQNINKEHRGIDKATDVLSFPLEDIEHLPLGSIVISADKAKEISQKFSHSLEDEIILLFIHGLLHLLGYDHEIDNGEMRSKEQEIIKKFNLPSSLIIRNS